MPRSKRTALSLAVISAMTVQIAIVIYVSSRNAAERSDTAGMDLVDDVLRASQAEVAAERMVSMSRAYLLTHEPDLLARAHAAEAKLQQMLQGLERRANALQERPLFDPVLISANHYRELFQRFLSDGSASSTPQAVADSLRKQLIPARDRFEADLEELIARRQHQLAELHTSTRDLSARAVPLMIGICAFGLIASVMLTRLVAAPPHESPPPEGLEKHPPASVTASRSIYPKLSTGARIVHISRPLEDGTRRR